MIKITYRYFCDLCGDELTALATTTPYHVGEPIAQPGRNPYQMYGMQACHDCGAEVNRVLIPILKELRGEK